MMDPAPSTSGTAVVNVTLEEEDIEGEEPLDSKTVPQLRWWLLCHGIQVPSSEKKAALIERLFIKLHCINLLAQPHFTQTDF